MRIRPLAAFAICLVAAVPARAADTLIERLTTCQDSWLDSKDDPAKMKILAETFNKGFKPGDKGGDFVPTTRTLVIGLPVARAYPGSVGTGVGFSVVVVATFNSARAAVQEAVGKSLTQCETGDGMRSCELEIADKRTLMLMADESGKSKQTLIGCYYYYEK